MKIEPHSLFEVWRPDEAAECMSGVPVELQRRLWELVELYTPEVSEVPDSFDNALSVYWDKLTEEQQGLLNELAIREVCE